jgi:hypothetical protein
MKFRAELESTGTTAAGFEVPGSVVAALGGGKHPKVILTVNGRSFRTSIAAIGGRFLCGLSAERRAEAGVAAGDVLDVEVELDTAPREVDVPDDFALALSADPAAAAFWDTLSYSNRSWHVIQIEGAKKAETRGARIMKSIGMLREGRAR